jgi:uncharacterized protein (TIGR03435 family)
LPIVPDPQEDPIAQHSRLEEGFSRPDFNRCERSCADSQPDQADGHRRASLLRGRHHQAARPQLEPSGLQRHWDRFTIRNQSLVSLMMFAYSIDKHQVVDAPKWTGADRFDIEGTTDIPGEPNLHQQQEMLQKLLTERFGLRFHHEKRQLPVYAIQIAKGGPKLKPPANPDAEADQEASNHGSEITVTITTGTMADFILGMQFFFDRPLIDQTGISGRHDFTLRYTHDEANATSPNAAPGLFTAIQEQLGLKLDALKAPIDVFVIDHVETPSAN